MKKFKRIHIEITNSCNLSCSFCPPSNRAHKSMSVLDFKEIMTKVEGHGDHIYLHVKGEPLVHPHFKEILDVAGQFNKKVNITTNGTLLERQSDVILQHPNVRLVSISLQSFEAMENETAYYAYLDQVLNFVKKGLETSHVLFDLRLWNFEDNHLIANAKNQPMLEYIESFLSDNKPVSVSAKRGGGVKLNSNVYISKGYEFEWPTLDREEITQTGSCYGLRNQIAILSNGDVVPCCLDAEGVIKLGNVFESSFTEIAQSERAKKIATGFENRKLVEELCRKCGYRERF